MDILDIDQALNDVDLSKLLEDDAELEDVSDIVKMWRTTTSNNNNIHEQGFKLNTRTFTRPKRRTVLNLESQFKESMETSQTISPQIGGLVTTFQKSFLQDTSPPPSICSSFSMDYSIDRLSNSLITSADFSNVPFFQSSTTQEDLENPFLEANYSISDLIRDRKTLDNLTMSGDSTIIKDSNIAQIDDVSLMSTSTINNSSTDSLSGSADLPQNNTVILNATFEAKNCDGTFTSDKKTEVTYDAIENTTFNMVNRTEILTKRDATFIEPNDTFTKPTPLNETFEKNCGTPETSFHIEQSTPHHTRFAPGKKLTPSFRGMIADEVNISPITSVKPTQENELFADGTYEENILKASCEGSNEDDFYDMLDKFGKYTPSAEKAKIQKTVDSIKKKYVQPSANGEEKSSLGNSFVKESAESSCTSSMTSSGNVCNKLTTSSTSLTTSTDRLLNRRGRLYDDIHMNISNKSLSLKESITTSNGGEKDENTAATSLEGGLDQIEEAGPSESDKRKTDIVYKKSGKIRDHDRFKTIKISKRSDEVNEPLLNVPCIDNEFDQEPAIEEPTEGDVSQRFSRKVSHLNSPNNFLTYKKPKEKPAAVVVDQVQSNARSLSRPRYISGLQKLSFSSKEILSKAASADDLEKSSITSSTTDLTEDPKVQPVNRFGLKKFSAGAQSRPSEVKSPMGNKAKSLHNLSNNFGFVAKKPGLRAPSVPASTVKSRPVSAYIQKAPESVFKVPQANPVALRKTVTASTPAAKKGMMRPSSGYYGSSSSADSLNSLNERAVSAEQQSKPKSMGLPQPKTMGIPKPSGLRPPSNLAAKKSGLPRPASVVRR